MDGIYIYSKSSTLDNYITNTQSSTLMLSATVYSSRVYGTVTSASTQIININNLTNSISIVWPQAFNIVNATVTVNGALLVASSIVNSTIVINISQITNSSITVMISSILLPTTAQILPITISTFNNNGFLISSGYLTTWTAVCSLPCLTCTSPSLNTQCLSCFNDYSITMYNLYDFTRMTCTDQCLPTQIQLNLTCVQCSPSCLTCSIITTNCTNCSVGLYLYQGQCQSFCPIMYYKLLPSRTC